MHIYYKISTNITQYQLVWSVFLGFPLKEIFKEICSTKLPLIYHTHLKIAIIIRHHGMYTESSKMDFKKKEHS